MRTKPGVIERARIALSVFRNGFPRLQGRRATKGITATLGDPTWHIIDYSSYVTEGFNMNTLIYSALMYKWRALQSAPLRAYTGTKDHPEPLPDDDPLEQLCARPNKYMSGTYFSGLVDIYLNIAGYAPVLLVRKNSKAAPEAMYPLRPDRVYVIPDPPRPGEIIGGVKGYVYVPEGKSMRDGGIPVLPSDMAFPKLPNPGDSLMGFGYGLSPFAPLAQSADVDNYVTRFLKLFFEHGTMISSVLKFEVPMDDNDISRVRERWNEIYGGFNNWTDVGILDQGGEYQRLGMTFDEMGFTGIDERNESRILGPLGVPPILIGARVGVSKAAYGAEHDTARKAFWEDTMLAEIKSLEDEWQYFIQAPNAFVAYDLTGVPALRKDTPALVTAWTQLVGLGVPKTQAAQVVGLELGELPDGDVVYMPMNMLPMGANQSEGDTTTDGAASATDETRKSNGNGHNVKELAALAVELKRANDNLERHDREN